MTLWDLYYKDIIDNETEIAIYDSDLDSDDTCLFNGTWLNSGIGQFIECIVTDLHWNVRVINEKRRTLARVEIIVM